MKKVDLKDLNNLDAKFLKEVFAHFGIPDIKKRSDEFKKAMIQRYFLDKGWISEHEFHDNFNAIYKDYVPAERMTIDLNDKNAVIVKLRNIEGSISDEYRKITPNWKLVKSILQDGATKSDAFEFCRRMHIEAELYSIDKIRYDYFEISGKEVMAFNLEHAKELLNADNSGHSIAELPFYFYGNRNWTQKKWFTLFWKNHNNVDKHYIPRKEFIPRSPSVYSALRGDNGELIPNN